MTHMLLFAQGRKRFRLKHPSGAELETDAPIDNHGKGDNFSPTDLLASSLVACMATILEIEMEKKGFFLEWAQAEVIKTMQPNPRMVQQIQIKFILPLSLRENPNWPTWKIAMEACPVALSLNEAIQQKIGYLFLEKQP